jgi:solute carrier family 35 protein
MLVSAGMSIFNKLAVVHLPLPLTIVTIQMSFTVMTLLLRPSSLRWGNSDDIKRWAFTVPLLFFGMLASSMVAMQYASLGTIVVCRNIAPLPTMFIEGMFRIPFVMTSRTVLSLLVIVAGVSLYEAHEIRFSSSALVAILVNMVFAVLERIMQRHLMANNPVDLSKGMMMLLNNGIGLIPTLLLALLSGEHRQWSEKLIGMDGRAFTFLLISCVNGLAISYAGIRLQHMVAATSFMVVTNVNKFAVILFGILTLGESVRACSRRSIARANTLLGVSSRRSVWVHCLPHTPRHA